MPWPGVGDGDIIDSIKAGAKLERPPGVPHACYDVMLACWHLDIESRPSADALLKMMDQLDDKDLKMIDDEETVPRLPSASSNLSKSCMRCINFQLPSLRFSKRKIFPTEQRELWWGDQNNLCSQSPLDKRTCPGIRHGRRATENSGG